MKRMRMGALLGALMLVGCVSAGDVAELKEGQKRIEAKLDALGKTPVRAPAAPSANRGPDPKKVHR
ncbi:MAG: hypothetical protein AAFY60_14005, partial [Myxococcota bacterium]